VQGWGSRRDLGFLGKSASRLRVRTFAVELAVVTIGTWGR
jgi:hypothetical protein